METKIIKHDKLIRDLVPISILKNGSNCKVETCKDKEKLLEYVKDKIYEEIGELLAADALHVYEEAADVFEIVTYYAALTKSLNLDVNIQSATWDIGHKRDEKEKEKGLFLNNFILKEVEETK